MHLLTITGAERLSTSKDRQWQAVITKEFFYWSRRRQTHPTRPDYWLRIMIQCFIKPWNPLFIKLTQNVHCAPHYMVSILSNSIKNLSRFTAILLRRKLTMKPPLNFLKYPKAWTTLPLEIVFLMPRPRCHH